MLAQITSALSPLFQSVKEATVEAVCNSLFRARTFTGYAGHTVEVIPVDKVLEVCREHKVIRDTR
jgi:D-aminopeptidase